MHIESNVRTQIPPIVYFLVEMSQTVGCDEMDQWQHHTH